MGGSETCAECSGAQPKRQ
ncbi:hypothetical protein J4G07_09115 [Candidatus Poribacteria bacterium]|nr:hypothetical protein [Candidatus Poribacteria bacterium]